MLGLWQASLDSNDHGALGDAGMVIMLSLSYAGSERQNLAVLGELEDERWVEA